MAKFEFWYDEAYTFKGWLEADSLDEAQRLAEQAEWGELDIKDLPGFASKQVSYELNIDHIEEV